MKRNDAKANLHNISTASNNNNSSSNNNNNNNGVMRKLPPIAS